MLTIRNLILSALIASTIAVTSIQQAQAVVPVIIAAVARQALVMTAEAVTVGVIAKGFAANDPYVRTTATLPRATFASRLNALRGSWAGRAAFVAAVAALGWAFDDELGFYTSSQAQHTGYCAPPNKSLTDYDSCFIKNFGSLRKYYVTDLITNASTGVMSVKLCYYGVTASNGCTSGTGAIFYVTSIGEQIKTPVSDSVFNESAMPLILASPNTLGDMLSGLSESQLADLFDGATIPYNATNATPEIAQLKDWYRNGLLQTTNPDADYYVTPEQYEEIKNLVAAEDALNTDDGLVDDLNSSLKQPLTQAQYEESNKKYSDAVDSVTNSVSSENDFSDIDDTFNKLDDFITDIPNSDLPSAASVNFPQYVSCRQLHLTDGNGHDLLFPNDSQCAKLEDVKQGFGYFLYVLCAFGLVWQLLTRPTSG